jgi:hypothetical protein
MLILVLCSDVVSRREYLASTGAITVNYRDHRRESLDLMYGIVPGHAWKYRRQIQRTSLRRARARKDMWIWPSRTENSSSNS